MRSRSAVCHTLLISVMCLAPDLAVGRTNDITVVLQPIADAEVALDFPDQNFGFSQKCRVRSEGFGPASSTSYVYLRFDLSGLPADAVISEATLAMNAFEGYAWGGDGNVYVHFVASDGWSETALTWNTRPAPGAVVGSWWLWYDNTPSDQIGTTSEPALAAAVQDEADGDHALSLMLRSPGYDTIYRTREHAPDQERPRLTIRYTTTTDVGPVQSSLAGLRLAGCVPNPTSREAVLTFALPMSGHASLRVLDAFGRRVATLVDGSLPAGPHEARWNTRSEAGERVRPGVYFARLAMGGGVAWRRVVVVE